MEGGVDFSSFGDPMSGNRWPSLEAELKQSREFADTTKYSTAYLLGRLALYQGIYDRNSLPAVGMGYVGMIRDRLELELQGRQSEVQDE